ncbi:hypothetical protein KAH37_07490 [bacterium]|nr:hypothetical protein [bacterium]
MRWFTVVLLLLISLVVGAKSLDKDDVKDPDIILQLTEDKTLLPMSKGGVFIPYLIDGQLEPLFIIKQGDKVIKKVHSGRRVALKAGNYEMSVGEGPSSQRMKLSFVVQNERTTVIIPTWSALVVRTVDANETMIRRSYQLGNENSKIIVGTGQGADELKGEKDRVWLLKPDLYRIMKRGLSLDSTRDYISVRMREGKGTYAYIVFDEKTGSVLGGGEATPDSIQAKKRGNWRLNLVLNGTFAYSNNSYVNATTGMTSSISLGSRITGTFIYDKKQYYWITKIDLFEQFQKPNDGKLLFDRDQFKLESSFVYRFNEYIGPYISFRGDTAFFSHHERVSDSPNVDTYSEESPAVVDASGNVVTPADRTLLVPGSYFAYSKNFAPTELTESTGLNFDYRADTMFLMTARVGWAVKEVFAHSLYDIARAVTYDAATGRYTRIMPRMKTFDFNTGPEIYLVAQFSPFSFVEFKEEFEMLMPVTGDGRIVDKIIFSSITTTTVWISSFASILYEFTIKRNAAVSQQTEMKHFVTIQLFYKIL